MIQRTSEMLKDNSAAIQEQAASSTIGMEQLQAAFANIYATMDSIDEFKLKALDSMAADDRRPRDRGREVAVLPRPGAATTTPATRPARSTSTELPRRA